MFLTTMLGVWVTMATEYEILVGTLDMVPAKEWAPTLRDVERYADDTRISIFARVFSMAAMRLLEITADRLAATNVPRNTANAIINKAVAITTSTKVNAPLRILPS